MAQMRVNTAYKRARYCAPEILAAVARDEVALPPPLPPQEKRKYCALLNVLCQMDEPDFSDYQARLLNAHRVLGLLSPCATARRSCLIILSAARVNGGCSCTRWSVIPRRLSCRWPSRAKGAKRFAAICLCLSVAILRCGAPL